DRPGAAEAAGARDLSEHRGTRPRWPVRRPGGLGLRLRPSGIEPRAPRGGFTGGNPAEPAGSQRAQSGPRRAPPGWNLYCSRAGLRTAVLAGKSRFLGRFSRNLNLALPTSILYKRGLIGIQPARPAAGVRKADDAFDNTLPRTLAMAVPRRKTSPSRRGMRRSPDAIKKP